MIQRYTIIHEREPVATEHGEHCLFVDHAAELERVKGLISIRENTEKDLRKQLADERAELAALRRVREAELAEVEMWRKWKVFGCQEADIEPLCAAVRATDEAREKYAAKGWTE